jgi:hypothetical protein
MSASDGFSAGGVDVDVVAVVPVVPVVVAVVPVVVGKYPGICCTFPLLS